MDDVARVPASGTSETARRAATAARTARQYAQRAAFARTCRPACCSPRHRGTKSHDTATCSAWAVSELLTGTVYADSWSG